MMYFKDETKRLAYAVLEDFFKHISKSRKYYWLIKDFLSDENAVSMWCGLAEIDESVFKKHVQEILEKRRSERKNGRRKKFSDASGTFSEDGKCMVLENMG